MDDEARQQVTEQLRRLEAHRELRPILSEAVLPLARLAKVGRALRFAELRQNGEFVEKDLEGLADHEVFRELRQFLLGAEPLAERIEGAKKWPMPR